MSSNAITLDHTVYQDGTGMDMRLAYSRPAEDIEIPTRALDGQSQLENTVASSVQFTLPALAEYKQTSSGVLSSDVLYKPTGKWALTPSDVSVYNAYIAKLRSQCLLEQVYCPAPTNSTNKGTSSSGVLTYWSPSNMDALTSGNNGATADTTVPANGFAIVPGPVSGDTGGAIKFWGNTVTSMRVAPHSLAYNTPTFSAEFWLQAPVRVLQDGVTGQAASGSDDLSLGALVARPFPILRSVGTDLTSGYAFALSSDGYVEFRLAVNSTSDLGDGNEEYGNMFPSRFSIVKGCYVGLSGLAWRHVVGVFDGTMQKLYCDGQVVASARVNDAHVPNRNGDLLLGLGCDDSCRQCKNPSSPCSRTPLCVALVTRLQSSNDTDSMCRPRPASGAGGVAATREYVPAMDDIVIYSTAVSEALIRGHIEAANASIYAGLRLSFGSTASRCADGVTCTIDVTDALTPSVSGVSPQYVWNDASIVVKGQRFGEDMSKVHVRIGLDDACTPTQVTDTQITCTVSGMTGNFGVRKLSVYIDERGQSHNSMPVRVTSRIDAVYPTEGSVLGGTTVTIQGHGFPLVANTASSSATPSSSTTTGAVPLISAVVGGIVCDVKRANSSAVICVMRRRQPTRMSDSGTMQEITAASAASFAAGDMNSVVQMTVTVGGEPSICFSSEACSFSFSAAVTPSVTSISTLCKFTDQIGCTHLDQLPVSTDIREVRLHMGTVIVIRGSGLRPIQSSCSDSTLEESGAVVDLQEDSSIPVVAIGLTLCEVRRATAALIVCTVKVGEGGRQPLSVRAPYTGYAVVRKSDQSGLDVSYLPVTALYAVKVTSLYPTTGSQFGGQTVTIVGSGFSQKQGKNAVLLGGLRASVLAMYNNSVLVVRTPKMSELGEGDVGAEQLLYAACSVSDATSTTNACNDSRADVCARIVGVSESVYTQKRIWATPAAHVSSVDEHLVDGDRNTIWRSGSSADTQFIVLDLGRTTTVSAVRIEWFGMSVAKNVSVSLAVECAGGASNALWSVSSTSAAPWEVVSNVNNIRNTSWDHTTVARFSSDTPARFVRITLRGRGDGNADFRIRGVVVVRPLWAYPGLLADSDSDIRSDAANAAYAGRSVSVLVNQLTSVCGTENNDSCDDKDLDPASSSRRLLALASLQDCVFEYTQSPSMHTIVPASALSGQTVTVQGTGFDASSCSNHRVRIGSSLCNPVGCDATSVWCTVPEQTAGRYTVRMTIDGMGDVKTVSKPPSTATPTDIVFDQQLSVSDIAPSEVSIGGEVRVSITGRGFGADASSLKVNVCGASCDSPSLQLPQNQASSVDASIMTCTMKAAMDFPKRVYTGSLDTVISSSSDDAYEMLVNTAGANSGMVSTVTTTPTMGFDMIYDQEWSPHTMYFRFSSIDLARMGWVTVGNTKTFAGNVTSARLYVRASRPGCIKGSVLRVQVRDAHVGRVNAHVS